MHWRSEADGGGLGTPIVEPLLTTTKRVALLRQGGQNVGAFGIHWAWDPTRAVIDPGSKIPAP